MACKILAEPRLNVAECLFQFSSSELKTAFQTSKLICVTRGSSKSTFKYIILFKSLNKIIRSQLDVNKVLLKSGMKSVREIFLLCKHVYISE